MIEVASLSSVPSSALLRCIEPDRAPEKLAQHFECGVERCVSLPDTLWCNSSFPASSISSEARFPLLGSLRRDSLPSTGSLPREANLSFFRRLGLKSLLLTGSISFLGRYTARSRVCIHVHDGDSYPKIEQLL